ncbi:hypothetical protein GGR53DRAFT_177070 [Hypoxylon sp. FL1150]|nr:hypothetical protein GGR53DRAFT_177070 [Hypoxylon sp. FL1150]
MTCELDPLGLYSPRYNAESIVLPGDMDSSPNFSIDSFQQLQWEAPLSQVMRYEQHNPDSSIAENSDDTYHDLDSASMIDASISPLSSWQPTEVYNIRKDIQGDKKVTECSVEYRDKRRRSQSKPSSSSSSLAEEFGVGSSQRRCLREKNRTAASKCRQKKKMETATLQAREKALAAKRDGLKSMVDALRMEVLGLKNEVLRHGRCDCSVIQNYIAETAKQIV